MPIPVATAKQCLTPEACHALDEAVTVARRRGHAQTTSLHAVSAFLSLPSSPLREACIRARNASFYPRVQFKALEFSLSLSLDRLPTTSNHHQQQQQVDEPPVSNSFMAAIKRSQANKRRQPDSLSIKQHQQGVDQVGVVGIGTSCVKVELEHLIVSILDDPIVSRVFNEAGFSSFDIKLAIVRPLHSFFRYPRIERPHNPFFCNLDENSSTGYVPFRFPFTGPFGHCDGNENLRRIGQILEKSKGRNPLLIGVSSADELQCFVQAVEHRRDNLLSSELRGICVVKVEQEILKIVNENRSEELLCSVFEQVGMLAGQCLGPGVLISVGDLKCILGADRDGARLMSDVMMNCVVRSLKKLMRVHGSRIWLIAAACHETYLKFVSKFPSIEMEWDLQLLPISSIKSGTGESCFKTSLMGSFVPFGGFFPSTSDFSNPLSSSNHSTRCNLCNEQCEEELAAGFGASVVDQYQIMLPSSLRTAEDGPDYRADVLKAKDDKMMVNPAVAGVLRKWDAVCQRLHHARSSPSKIVCQEPSSVQTSSAGGTVFSKPHDGMNCSRHSCSSKTSQNDDVDVDAAMSISFDRQSTTRLGFSVSSGSITKNDTFLGKLLGKPAKVGLPLAGPGRSLPLSSTYESQTSPTSASTVTTDLGLGLFPLSSGKEEKKGMGSDTRKFLNEYNGSLNNHEPKLSGNPARFSNCPKPDVDGQTDPGSVKALFETLISRVGRQTEALRLISHTIARCKNGNGRPSASVSRGDIGLHFVGLDTFGKRKVAVALSEVLYGGRDKFINVNLSEENWEIHHNMGCGGGARNGPEVAFRCKTVVDYIACELAKKPRSIVFLENVHSADPLVRNSLLQAVRSGKFSDSYGREVSITNAAFVMTSKFNKNSKICYPGDSSSISTEERIIGARGRPIEIIVKDLIGEPRQCHNFSVITAERSTYSLPFLNKRKHKGTGAEAFEMEPTERPNKCTNACLDLNLPAEETEVAEMDNGSVDENSAAWLEDLVGQLDETVYFEPFEYIAVANKLQKLMVDSFGKIFSSQSVLEIESRVLDQITAAAASSEKKNEVEDWLEKVLSKGFLETRKRHFLAAHCVVKVATCQPLYDKDQATGSYLPPTVILK